MNRVLGAAVALFLIGLAEPVQAEDTTGIRFYGIGGSLSIASPENWDAGFALGAHADIGEIMPNLSIVPNLSTWRKTRRASGYGYTVEATLSQFAANADLRYRFPTRAQAQFYAGGGLGLNFNSVSYSEGYRYYRPGFSVSGTEIGLNLLGGVEMPLSGSLIGMGQLKYGVGDIDTFFITAGITVPLVH